MLTWENLVEQPLYRLPPYREAFRRSLDADLLLCLVHSARRHLLEHGVDDDRIRVVHPGVDTEVFQPAPEPVTEPVAAFVSPLAANKGIDTVLEAMALVRPLDARGPAGRHGFRPARAAGAARGRGGRRRLPGAAGWPAGRRPGAAVGRRLRHRPRATWKWTEQFGLAYVEAAACGLPVVTTVCGSNDEAVRPPNLLTANSAEAVADGLLGLLGDPDAAPGHRPR